MIRPAGAADLPAILWLTERSGLPREGIEEHLGTFLIAEKDGQVVGTAGLEVYEDVALLRSVAVDPAWRGMSLGTTLVQAALTLAQGRDVKTIALLTETAAPFFQRLGFAPILRDDLDPRLAASSELSGACAETAIAMAHNISA